MHESLNQTFLARQETVLLEITRRSTGLRKTALVNEDGPYDGGDYSSAMSIAENALTSSSNTSRLIADSALALSKIKNGTYGMCELTGELIGIERLEAIPWARFSIEAQQEIEKKSNGRSRSANITSLFDDSLKESSSEDSEPDEESKEK